MNIEFKEPLPEKEQLILFEKFKETQDPGIREKLIVHNLKLVNWVALKYYKPGKNDLDDLFQVGVIGLMRAIEDYDANKGSFGTYAVIWIRQAITRDIDDYERVIRVPVHMAQNIKKLKRIRNKLMQTLERDPTIEEISWAMELDIENVMEILGVSEDTTSLNTIIGGEDEDITLEEAIPDDAPTPDEIVEDKVFVEQIKEAIKPELTDLQYDSIVLYYGLDGKEYTLKEIACKYGFTHQYIRSERQRTLRILRGLPFMQELHKEIYAEIDERTSYYKSIDYTQPRVMGGMKSSPVENIVLHRERLSEEYLKKRKGARDEDI